MGETMVAALETMFIKANRVLPTRCNNMPAEEALAENFE
jgi:hypothetical protein